MRRRIMIEKHETVKDKIGNHTSRWQDYHECFAYINLTSANEYGMSPETISKGSFTFIVRWCSAISKINSKEYRIRFRGDAYNITGIDDVQLKHEKIRLIAEKEVRNGGKD